VFAFAGVLGQRGDHATPSSSVGGLTFHTIGSGSQVYNGGKDYESGWWVNGGASDAIGTISVTFVYRPAQIYLQVIELSGNDTSNPIAQNAYATGANTNPYIANLPAPPLAGTNFDVYFLDANVNLGNTTPVGTPTVTNLVYAHAGPGSAATYFANTPSQNESFAGGNHQWATIAVEIKRP